jgi:hypothetical protein
VEEKVEEKGRLLTFLGDLRNVDTKISNMYSEAVDEDAIDLRLVDSHTSNLGIFNDTQNLELMENSKFVKLLQLTIKSNKENINGNYEELGKIIKAAQKVIL